MQSKKSLGTGLPAPKNKTVPLSQEGRATVGAGSACPDIPPQFLTLLLLICIQHQVFLNVLFDRKKHQKLSAQVSKLAYLATLVVKNSSKLGFNSLAQAFASRSRLLLVSYHVTSLIRLLLAACVCRSNLGNKRTRFTYSLHRMAHTLRHFCSYSSIGTDTRCRSNGAGFLFDITIVRGCSIPLRNFVARPPCQEGQFIAYGLNITFIRGFPQA